MKALAAIEAGKYSPSLEAAFRIAEVLGKDLGEIFRWESDPPLTSRDERAQGSAAPIRPGR